MLTLLSVMTLETRGQQDRESKDYEVFVDPEKMAVFPGGNDSLRQFINKKLVVPTTGKKKGKVFVTFIVNVDGSLSDVKIEKGLTAECDISALELIQKMPNWIPGTVYGTPVRQRLVLPINFE